MQETQEVQGQSLEKSPGGGRAPTPVFLHGESHGQRSLVDYSPEGLKEMDTTEQLSMTWHSWHGLDILQKFARN